MGTLKKLIVLVPLIIAYGVVQFLPLHSSFPEKAEAKTQLKVPSGLKSTTPPSVPLTREPPINKTGMITTEVQTEKYVPPVTHVYTYRSYGKTEIEQMILNMGGDYNLIRIMYCESSGNPQAYNASFGAAGLFQFLPATWRGLGGSTYSARDASVDEQVRLGVRLWNHGLGARNWVCK